MASPPTQISFRDVSIAVACSALLLAAACTGGESPGATGETAEEGEVAAPAAPAGSGDAAGEAARPAWALAIHGGAGVIPKTMEEEARREYVEALEAALAEGRDLLAAGGASLDVVETVIRRLEDDPHFNAGKGAVFNHEGRHELDAAVMDGRDLEAGAVAGVTTVRHPISLARLGMERSQHVLLFGEGAERFAGEQGVERVDNSWFDTQRRREQLDKALEKERAEAESGGRETGTVGAVALDTHGNLAAATSTGGLTAKRWGRVGDVPIIGAGTYADNRTAAISCTGTGEVFIRHNVAHDVAARMLYKGIGLEQAAREVIHGELEAGDGGLIAVGHDGSIALVFNSEGMFRGAADAAGRFEVAIWE
jgi:beta-aspartyl-peptidase (threonine type)